MAEIEADQAPSIHAPTCMESVNRIAKLPVVETTFQTATNIYEKVKDFNSVTQWTCSTAESAVHKVVEVGKPITVPIVQGLEGPIKKVDEVLCTGLDYVESKVPAVKLPPGEMYNTTKDYVNRTVTPVVSNVYEKIEPAVQGAKTVVEPAVTTAKNIVEPLVQPAIDTANALKDYGMHKYEQVMHSDREHEHAEGVTECEECQAAARKNHDKSE